MKNMKLKILTLTIATLLLSTLTAASTLGTYTSTEFQDIDDLQTTFEIKVINLGDQTIETTLNTTEIEEADLIYEENHEIEPSTITDSPGAYELNENEEWFLMDDQYVKAKEIPITVTIHEERTYNTHEFTATLEAKEQNTLNPETEDDDEVAPQQEIIQTRSYDFRLTTNAERTSSSTTQESTTEEEEQEETSGSLSFPTTDGGFLSDNQEQSDSYDFTISDNEDTEEQNELEESENTEQQQEDTDQIENQENEENGQNTAITGDFLAAASTNLTTIILFLTSIISMFYLIKVI